MKKSNLIRSDKPHAVKMTEGSNVAQRKSSAKKTAAVAQEALPDNIQKVTPVKPIKTKRVTAPETLKKPTRAQAPLKRQPAAGSAKPQTRQAVRVKRTPIQEAGPAELPVWELDNPIKARIEQLKVVNAQLSEQLQRLPSSRSARGIKP